MRRFVVVVQIGQMRKIDSVYGNTCSKTRIIAGQRNIGISAHRAGKKSTTKIDNLQSIIGEQQSCGDAIERQGFPKEIVLHPVRVVDRNLEMRVLAAAKLVYAIGGHGRRMAKFVRDNGFPNLRVNPKNRLRWMQRAFDI